jgi:flagellar biosynthesis/type III secretory pathway M-ring protein FliF/YscJ
MNEALRQLLAQLKGASLATVATFACLLLGGAALAGGFLMYSNQPHYEVLWQDLSDAQFAAVGAALAEAGIDFRGSQVPGPFVIYVDGAKMAAARAAMFASGALNANDGGILTRGNAMGSVFLSAGERDQLKRKREWEEMEQMLETLDFVLGARVRTYSDSERSFGSAAAITGSVTLTLVPGVRLDREQARTVARLVRFGLGVDEQQLVVADQSSTAVYDGGDLGLDGAEGEDWIARGEREERRLETKANLLLSDVLGPDAARVAVRSEWDYDAATIVQESGDPKQAIPVYQEESTSSTPQFAPQVAGGAGSSGGLGDSGDGASAAPRGGGEPAVAKTAEKRTEYLPQRTVSETVRRTPTLRRLSVSLFLDESLAAQREDIVRAVKATVGFDAERGDSFEHTLLGFVREETAAAGGVTPDGEPTQEGPSPLIELLLNRGVEVISACAFVALLFVSLRGARQRGAPLAETAGLEGPRQSRGGVAALSDQDIDPELLAIRQVEELLATDPERVGRILSSWAREHGMARL